MNVVLQTYANTSTTSEEDEIIKKEREILEILELEEQRHYETESKNEYNNLGEKLVLRLQELERQKASCWSREQQELLNNQRNLVNQQQNYIKYEVRGYPIQRRWKYSMFLIRSLFA